MRLKNIFRISTIGGLFLLMITTQLFAGEIVGAGATFPYPFYSKLFDIYHSKYKLQINYQSIGSGGGIRQLQNKTVNFGASDTFLTNDQLAQMPGKIVHIPTCLGAVVVIYQLPTKVQLKLTGELIAQIFMGKINKWNDPAIKAINPGINLPNTNIIVVHRSDGSGTTAIFTDYLAKISSEWQSRVGAAKDIKWPAGLGGKGNEGVAGLIKQIPGSIGYVELNYAVGNKMNYAMIQNKSGQFVLPTVETTSAAAEDAIPQDTRIFLTNPDTKNAYPISGFTWILVYQDLSLSTTSKEQATELAKLLNWMIKDGQSFATSLGYASLPKDVVAKTEKNLKSLTYKDKILLK